MKTSLSELIDRATILKLKIENLNNPLFNKELSQIKEAIKEFEHQGVKINPKWTNKLYKINKYQWGLESKLKKLKSKKNLLELGKLYIEIQISNKKRMTVKNEIAKKTGSGFRDIKVN